MLKHLQSICIAILVAGSLASCESATTPNVTDTSGLIRSTDRAVFVVNEGKFGSANSTLDVVVYRNAATTGQKLDTITYPNVLTGLGSGNDVIRSGKSAFILDAGSSTLYTVRIDSLLKTSVLNFGLTQPNKMAIIAQDRLLVTQRGSNSAVIIDLTKNQIVDSVVIGEPSVAVAVLNNKAYVTSGGFGTAGHVNIVNLTTHKVTKSIEVVTGAEAIVADSANTQFVVESYGNYTTIKPVLYWFNGVSDQMKDSLIASQTGVPALVAGSKVFLIDGGKVSQVDMKAHTIGNPVISGSTILYQGAYNVETDELYLGVSDFTSATGKVNVYDAVSGTFKWAFTTGIAPAHFAFYN